MALASFEIPRSLTVGWMSRWFGTDLAKGKPTSIEQQAAKAGGVGKYLAGGAPTPSAPVTTGKRKEAGSDFGSATLGGAEKKKKKSGTGWDAW